MPPYIEVDSHHNDECTLLQKSSTDNINKNNNFPSPLFHDDVLSTPPPTTSRLDRRQSDPGFTGLSSVQEDPMKKPLLDSRVGEVSRIQEIIGPESAYVRTSSISVNNNNSTNNNVTATNNTTNTTPKPRIVYKNGIPQKPKSQQSEEKKKDLPSLEVQIYRTTKSVCKKGVKALKSISKKCKLSTLKNSKKNKNTV